MFVIYPVSNYCQLSCLIVTISFASAFEKFAQNSSDVERGQTFHAEAEDNFSSP